ncbi:hypothetical protein BJ123_108136 [Rhodopseudomonas thermotolerans]|uniref:Uncharacterized protein n=2 Tax=Rhodopseudomonas TaxID=1073 RepID=A0A336JXK1_9BRAD|nr:MULTISPECIES: hypothetical protein [Rhodopseudomonas]RED36201.1 hypothetical protein BJ125_108136 [Rhodopseudomonas pentothenatexigens]REG03573.1 hypothetical protein BJ123_108136 [Rhodopseudomonas thermotolerans]SSW90761.1 hypothetical protein SAMN05892882_108136 [Rhodopseudomonas pentothenatexigens]
MKPLWHYLPDVTTDLTAGKLHRLDDGSVVAYFPKKWEKLADASKLKALLPDGSVVEHFRYRVTEWDVVEIKSAEAV